MGQLPSIPWKVGKLILSLAINHRTVLKCAKIHLFQSQNLKCYLGHVPRPYAEGNYMAPTCRVHSRWRSTALRDSGASFWTLVLDRHQLFSLCKIFCARPCVPQQLLLRSFANCICCVSAFASHFALLSFIKPYTECELRFSARDDRLIYNGMRQLRNQKLR